MSRLPSPVKSPIRDHIRLSGSGVAYCGLEGAVAIAQQNPDLVVQLIVYNKIKYSVVPEAGGGAE
jgi:hypothetical protein